MHLLAATRGASALLSKTSLSQQADTRLVLAMLSCTVNVKDPSKVSPATNLRQQGRFLQKQLLQRVSGQYLVQRILMKTSESD